MMSDPISRICLMLASSSLSALELNAFAKWLNVKGPLSLVRIIEEIRESASSGARERGLPRSGTLPSKASSLDFDRLDNLVQKVEQALLGDVGLGKALAAELLYEELRNVKKPGLRIPELGRQGFGNWVRRVAEQTDESTVLHLAMKIRNELMHGRKLDWSVSDRDQ